jgi:hypothetical protein
VTCDMRHVTAIVLDAICFFFCMVHCFKKKNTTASWPGTPLC